MGDVTRPVDGFTAENHEHPVKTHENPCESTVNPYANLRQSANLSSIRRLSVGASASTVANSRELSRTFANLCKSANLPYICRTSANPMNIRRESVYPSFIHCESIRESVYPSFIHREPVRESTVYPRLCLANSCEPSRIHRKSVYEISYITPRLGEIRRHFWRPVSLQKVKLLYDCT